MRTLSVISTTSPMLTAARAPRNARPARSARDSRTAVSTRSSSAACTNSLAGSSPTTTGSGPQLPTNIWSKRRAPHSSLITSVVPKVERVRQTQSRDQQMTVAQGMAMTPHVAQRHKIVVKLLARLRQPNGKRVHPLRRDAGAWKIRCAQSDDILGMHTQSLRDERFRLIERDDVAAEAPRRRGQNSGVAFVNLRHRQQ